MANDDVERDLLAHLSDKKLDKVTLKRYTAAINDLRKNNFTVDRIWRYGQPAADDGIIVGGRIKTSELGNLTNLFGNGEIKALKVFPLGTINPEELEIRFQIGDLIKNVEL